MMLLFGEGRQELRPTLQRVLVVAGLFGSGFVVGFGGDRGEKRGDLRGSQQRSRVLAQLLGVGFVGHDSSSASGWTGTFTIGVWPSRAASSAKIDDACAFTSVSRFPDPMTRRSCATSAAMSV